MFESLEIGSFIMEGIDAEVVAVDAGLEGCVRSGCCCELEVRDTA
jgi:hypothetical protein